MKFHQLEAIGKKARKRVGRGISAGGGKTAGRGTKGQNARTGGGVRRGFEGGQNPLISRLPKTPGFKSKRTPKTEITTGQLENIPGKVVDINKLLEVGFLKAPTAVKVIVKGELKTAKTVKLDAASAGAIAAIKNAGGSFDAVASRSKSDKTKKSE